MGAMACPLVQESDPALADSVARAEMDDMFAPSLVLGVAKFHAGASRAQDALGEGIGDHYINVEPNRRAADARPSLAAPSRSAT
jgi:hypothetical protein